MQRVFDFLTVRHEWSLTLLAAAVCLAGLASGLALLGWSKTHGAPRHRRWYGLSAGLVAGLAVWAAHVIAILAYRPGIPVRYDAPATVASLLIVLVAFTAAAVMARRTALKWRRLAISACMTAGVAAMHFVGVSALSFAGHFVWNPWIAVGAVVLGFGLCLAGITLSDRKGLWRIPIGATLGTAAVLALHFGAMAAARIVADPVAFRNSDALSSTVVFVWIGGIVAVIVAVAAFMIGLGYWSRARSLDQLREAIDAMPDGLGIFDADDRLMVWNAHYAEMNPELASSLSVGMSFRQIIRVGLDEGLYADAVGREQDWVGERVAARRGLSSTMEQRIAGDRWLRVQDRRTTAGGVVTVCTDITDLKRDAQALAEARDAADAANLAKSEFLANMSHEIRTPLNGVIGLAQVLARTDLDDSQREMLDLIQSSGHTLQTLLSDILDLARVESGRLELADEPFDLTRAVHEAAQLYATAAADKGLQFFVDIDPEAAVWAQGDPVRLKQILTNLVSNAVKFTAQGFVSLTVTRGTQADGASLLRFTVEDTGVGFDAVARARLFTRFEQADGTITRRFGGTGLGLAICRQLAEMMSGHLDCESEPGGGSAFILTLPLTEVAAPDVVAPSPSIEAEPAGDRIRVLLADDHPTNRKVVELILAQAPVDLVSVEDGAQALAAYLGGTFDLVLMDMQMPVMDGLTATREIRLHELAMGGPRVPIVMLTANALPDHIAAGKAAGADRHLAKPFDAADLLALVADLPGQSAAQLAA